MAQLRIGILGGTFDPVHDAHLAMAQAAFEALKLSEVRFMLGARPPHRSPPIATIEHRWAMLQLALEQTDQYIADDREILRDGFSYTVDSLRQLRAEFPQSALCLLLGQDAFNSLDSWHHWQQLPELAHLVVMQRPGWQQGELPDWAQARLVKDFDQLTESAAGKLMLCPAPLLDISSTQVRQQLVRKDNKLPLSIAVIDYIRQHSLYQETNNTMNSEQIAAQIIRVLDDMKGVDIRRLDVRDITDITDFMIIVSGTSDRHVKALANAVDNELSKNKVKAIGSEGQDQGDWVLLDFTDVIVHVMKPEVRELYELEKWWDEDMRELVARSRQ